MKCGGEQWQGEMALGNSIYKRSPDKEDACVTPSGGGGGIQTVGGGRERKKKMGEEMLTGSVTDSCQENECATTTHTKG